MMKRNLAVVVSLLVAGIAFAQDDYLEAEAKNSELIYPGGEAYPVELFPHPETDNSPKNVILLIADGMGFPHLQAAFTANHGQLFMSNFRDMGMLKTTSLGNFLTGSAAAGTAMACGVKAAGKVLGLDPDGQPVPSVLHQAEDHGLATGLVSTSAITHATPAAFIAHNESRYNYEEIATDFLKTDIDVFIGGGLDHFEKRSDGRDLVAELEQKGYQIVRSQEAFTQVESGKLAALTNPLHTERIRERGKYLEAATRTALAILDNDPEGFFLMVEGSLVDFGGHAASTIYVVEETLDFDRAVGVALEFAAQNKETLVIVTADHETGGMAVLNGDESTGRVEASFATHAHTGLLVPLMAFGPGSSAFTGFIDNTELNQLMRAALFGKD